MKYDYYSHCRFSKKEVVYRFPVGKLTGGQVFSKIHCLAGWRTCANPLFLENWIKLSPSKAYKLFPSVVEKPIFSAIKLLKSAGFTEIVPINNHNQIGIPKDEQLVTYQYNGLVIALIRKSQWTMQEFVNRIANQAAYRTRVQIKQKMSSIDFGVDGYVNDKKN